MDIKQAEKIIKALANKRRLTILKYLQKVRRASVTVISKEIQLSFKATSKHLGILRSADLLEKDQVNLMALYRLQEPVHSILRTVLRDL